LPRGNLTVKTGTLATKVLVEGTQVTGVRYLHDGAEHVARSRGEVLLCGERSTAPKLAMASRIIRSACRSGTLLPPATSGRR